MEESWESFDPTLNKYTWLSLQLCMIEILKVQGGNNYKLPHIGKRALDRLGILPENMEVDEELIEQASKFFNDRFRLVNQEQQDPEQELIDAD